jgi:hypothetical protein
LKINIAGIEYTIIKTKDYSRDYSYNGTFCGNSAEIKIEKDLKLDQTKSVLLHEILEAINFHYELGLEHNKISILESAIFGILQENKNLRNFLLSDKEEDNII